MTSELKRFLKALSRIKLSKKQKKQIEEARAEIEKAANAKIDWHKPLSEPRNL